MNGGEKQDRSSLVSLRGLYRGGFLQACYLSRFNFQSRFKHEVHLVLWLLQAMFFLECLSWVLQSFCGWSVVVFEWQT